METNGINAGDYQLLKGQLPPQAVNNRNDERVDRVAREQVGAFTAQIEANKLLGKKLQVAISLVLVTGMVFVALTLFPISHPVINILSLGQPLASIILVLDMVGTLSIVYALKKRKDKLLLNHDMLVDHLMPRLEPMVRDVYIQNNERIGDDGWQAQLANYLRNQFTDQELIEFLDLNNEQLYNEVLQRFNGLQNLRGDPKDG